MYGVTVCTNMIFTTILYLLCMIFYWKSAPWKPILFSLFLFVDFSFWGSVLIKVPQGGYVAIILSLCFFVLMFVWYLGEYKLKKYFKYNAYSTQIQFVPRRILPWTQADEQHLQSLESEEEKDISPYKKSSKAVVPVKDEDSSSTSEVDVSHSEQSKEDTLSSSDVKKNKEPKLSARTSANQSSTSSDKSTNRQITLPPQFTPSLSDSFLKIRMRTSDNSSTVLKAVRFPQVVVFITDSKYNTPRVFEEFLNLFRGYPQTVVFLKIHNANSPYVQEDSQVSVRRFTRRSAKYMNNSENNENNEKSSESSSVSSTSNPDDEGEEVYLMQTAYGYADTKVDILERIKLAQEHGFPKIDPNKLTFVVPAVSIQVVNPSIFWRIPLYLYSKMKSLFVGVINRQLPLNTVTVGTVAPL
eukprot:TRINITY_DN524_c0_g1_i1.p2 TRINITY_DN524_c0_g1~~TRINITY_DN524_c0_g1_i1.p2  ORF type:complete len:413 (-),score=114.93 TRINITY_DN524_c0_g1_i1:108-1346(-)